MAEDLSKQNDGWDTENQSSYSPFKFYFRGGGSESSPVGVRVPIFLYRRMQELIQSGKLPYKTFGDIARDCFYHRIRWLEDNLPLTKPIRWWLWASPVSGPTTKN